MSEIRVFSGIQPSGEMHLGNYLGAVRQWVENQGKVSKIFIVLLIYMLIQFYEILKN